MYFKGDQFKYYYNNEPKTKEEIKQLVDYDTTVSIDNFCVNYFSPKKELEKDIKLRLEDIKDYILSDNTIEKDLTDIIYLITAESEEQLIQRFSEVRLKEESKEVTDKSKMQELLKEADEHQEQNGGILVGVEFPFDMSEYATPYLKALQEQKVIEDWNKGEEDLKNIWRKNDVIENWTKEEFYITPPTKENLDRMCDDFQQRLERTSNKCEILRKNKKLIGGQKYNKLKAPLDILQTRQFPKALQLLALATAYGNHKYKDTDSDFLNFKRVEGGSQTYLDASARHSTNRDRSDIESGLYHIIHAVWNQLAALEIWAEENKIDVDIYSKKYLKNLEIRK